jgi:metallo-beta-lactamase family protein
VDRTQELLVLLADLAQEGRLPKNLPVYIDSPMALDALNLYKQFHAEYNEAFAARARRSPHPLALPNVHPVRHVEGSKALNDLREPAVILSASGMCNGGRIEHHLKFKLPDPRHTVLFVGFQAKGTKGRRILDGEPEVTVLGEPVPVRAEVAAVPGLSAHADRGELLAWAAPQPAMPDVFVVHGEDTARAGLAAFLRERLDWTSLAPRYGEIARL